MKFLQSVYEKISIFELNTAQLDKIIIHERYGSFIRISCSDLSIKRTGFLDLEIKATKCNFGNKRYWFLCPCCNKARVTLYIAHRGEWPSCRECLRLKYASKSKTRLEREFKTVSSFSCSDLEKIRREIVLIKYAGKYTRKYKKYINLKEKRDEEMNQLVKML